MLKQTTIIAMLVLMSFFVASAWGLDFQEGQYEITSKVEMAGMPMQMPPTTITECLTQQDPVPDQSTIDQNCKIINMQTKGETVSWEMECTQEGQKMKSTGKMVYRGDHFEGTINTTMAAQGGNMTIVTTVRGKRIGPCP